MRTLLLLSLATVALGLTGCEDDVDPTLGTDQAFTFYGYLDPTADRQALRVIPITATIDDGQVVTGASLTTTDLGTGAVVTWRDSVVTFGNGEQGTVFVADYSPAPGSTVQVKAVAADGREATATVEVPPVAPAELEAPSVANGQAVYPVVVRGVPRVISGRLRVFVTGLPSAPNEVTPLTIPIENLSIQRSGSDWRLVVPFLRATRDYLERTALLGAGLKLVEVEFAPFVTNEEWDTRGLDDEALVEPGTFSNVTGGFGFIGAGYRAPVRWVPSISTQARAGFAVDSDPAGQIVINEVGPGFVELYNPTIDGVNVAGYILSNGETTDGGTPIQGEGTVPGGGFLVVNVSYPLTENSVVALFSQAGVRVATTVIGSVAVGSETARAYGSYPDGRSRRLPQGGPDIFKGPLLPTPGAPNQPAYVPAVINEVYTEGDGWVEAFRVLDVDVGVSFASQAIDAPQGVGTTQTGDFFVGDESESAALELSQAGGEVYLLATYDGVIRVVDYRVYGPQDPGRSVGYLPDGGPSWVGGLSPTRGAPNTDGTTRIANRQ